MKRIKLLTILAVLLTLQSCVEDDLGFPDEQAQQLSGSQALQSYLNDLDNSTDHSNCFEFIYPITIGYNNGIPINIENKNGLLEAVGSQRSSFHISGIRFPVLVNRGGELLSIEDESGFISLLETCEIPTLREQLEETWKQCYELVYPLSLMDQDGNKTSIENDAALINYFTEAGNSYQPFIVFPIQLQPYANAEVVTAENLYDLFQLLNTCKGCPEISFAYDDITDFRYRFEAEITPDVSSFDWYINDRKVKMGSPNNLVLEETFTPGVYNVCIKASTDFCNQGVSYCEELVIESKCPELHFEPVQGETNSTYTFFAEFPNMTDVESYTWAIDGNAVEEEFGANRDNKLYWQFETGIHEVCISNESVSCPEGAEYCEEIAAGCLPLNYIWEEETYGYVLTPDFAGAHLITYIWKVFVNDQLIEEEVHLPGDEVESFVLDELEPGVTYEVCLIQDGCLDFQACQTFTW